MFMPSAPINAPRACRAIIRARRVFATFHAFPRVDDAPQQRAIKSVDAQMFS